jgi:hypothetical protein
LAPVFIYNFRPTLSQPDLRTDNTASCQTNDFYAARVRSFAADYGKGEVGEKVEILPDMVWAI